MRTLTPGDFAAVRRRMEIVGGDLVHPLGIVVREHVLYLVGTFWDYDNPIHLLLHRITEATLDVVPRKIPEGFDLDNYVASGEFGFRVSEGNLPLELRIKAPLDQMLAESPLGADQVIEGDADEGWSRLTVSVPHTKKLEAWLMGYGPMVEVVGPAVVREAVAGRLREAAALYEEGG